jgi:hypothetical protein
MAYAFAPAATWWAIEVSARHGDTHEVCVERASDVLRSISRPEERWR